MDPVTPEMIDYYTRLLKDLDDSAAVNDHMNVSDGMLWMVVRGREAPLTVIEVVSRLGADPGQAVPRHPLCLPDPGYVALEQTDQGVIIVAPGGCSPATPEAWAQLTNNAEAWGFWWLVNNANELFYAADGVLVTALNILYPQPSECTGHNPQELDAYLGALRALADQKRTDDETGERPSNHYRDWETALATMEAMSGVRLDVGRFTQEQQSVHAPVLDC
ncbi:hypothetical protein EDD27_9322 [Nonomuraea polychroma]|uniref:Uncharacterized protein n=1 Tax=Nonomuraea polychroma TaxID=46176 RepID=A0A438ML13_9ACTN|nr:hypothetical protein [Nonomuraea polychroma]RVX46438.1 hypothetical protein EDD27_9322 [Nonomuraea polychroma]